MKGKKLYIVLSLIIVFIILFLVGLLNYSNYYDMTKYDITNGCCTCDDCPMCDVCCNCKDKNIFIKSYKGYLYIFKRVEK